MTLIKIRATLTNVHTYAPQHVEKPRYQKQCGSNLTFT